MTDNIEREPETLLPDFEPMVTAIPLGWEFAYIAADSSWPHITVKNLAKDRFGNLIAELSVSCAQPEIMTPILGIKYNFSNLSGRKRIVQGIKEAYIDLHNTWIDWGRILGDVSWRVHKLYGDSYTTEDIWPLDDIPEPAFLLNPLLPLHQPTIIFGDGGSGKGHIGVMAGILASLPFTDNNLGIATQDQRTNTLYLDYEAERSDFERTLSGICKGFDIAVGMKRLAMSQPLADCVESLRTLVSANDIGFLIIDSLGLAAGGDINTAESANHFWAALKTIPNVTSLIVAHNSKDPLSRKKSVYGSVFFSLIARSVWECKKSQDTDSPEMVVSLTHHKYNRKRQLPLGFRFNFDDATNTISITRCDLAGTELESELPLRQRIKSLLLGETRLDTKTIAEILEANEDSVRAELNRQKKLFVKLGTEWGLLIKA